jgi:hypothetical protein
MREPERWRRIRAKTKSKTKAKRKKTKSKTKNKKQKAMQKCIAFCVWRHRRKGRDFSDSMVGVSGYC